LGAKNDACHWEGVLATVLSPWFRFRASRFPRARQCRSLSRRTTTPLSPKEHEFGLLASENPLQGSAFIEWLTDRVEQRVLEEFEHLSERGGVLGAMETGYQLSTPSRRALPDADIDSLPAWQRPRAYALAGLQHAARTGGNVFVELLQTVCCCSLGQITHALYEVGDQYRRSM